MDLLNNHSTEACRQVAVIVHPSVVNLIRRERLGNQEVLLLGLDLFLRNLRESDDLTRHGLSGRNVDGRLLGDGGGTAIFIIITLFLDPVLTLMLVACAVLSIRMRLGL